MFSFLDLFLTSGSPVPPLFQIKAPHAPYGTLPRQRRGKQKSYVWSNAHNGMIERPRLFKGHRP